MCRSLTLAFVLVAAVSAPAWCRDAAGADVIDGGAPREALAAGGAGAAAEGTEADSLSFRTGPAQSLIASAVYPGLGQLLNHTERKAAVVGGVEAFLLARLLLEDRWTRHAQRLYNETGESRYFDEYSRHFDTRQTLLWWAIVAALYGIADAYVDAHLTGFDDLRPDVMGEWSDVPGNGDGAALRVGFACRF